MREISSLPGYTREGLVVAGAARGYTRGGPVVAGAPPRDYGGASAPPIYTRGVVRCGRWLSMAAGGCQKIFGRGSAAQGYTRPAGGGGSSSRILRWGGGPSDIYQGICSMWAGAAPWRRWDVRRSSGEVRPPGDIPGEVRRWGELLQDITVGRRPLRHTQGELFDVDGCRCVAAGGCQKISGRGVGRPGYTRGGPVVAGVPPGYYGGAADPPIYTSGVV